MSIEGLLIIGLVILVLWRTRQPEKLKKKFVTSLLRSKPIAPKHNPPRSFPSLVTDDDRAFFNDFADFGSVVNWWLAGEDEGGPWRMQELPDTECRLDFIDSPVFGRRYEIFHNQVQIGELEVSPSVLYASGDRKVYSSLELEWVRLLSFHAVDDLLAGIAFHICSEEKTEARMNIDRAVSKVLWQAQQIDTLDLGINYGVLNLRLEGAARWYFQRREAFRKHAAA